MTYGILCIISLGSYSYGVLIVGASKLSRCARAPMPATHHTQKSTTSATHNSTMSADGLPAPHHLLGQIFPEWKSLKGRVAHELSEEGRGFRMGRGGSTQKKFICSGRTSDGGGCESEIRATLGRRTGGWKVSYVELEHVNCSGGVAKATGATLAPFAAEAISNNPDMSGAELGRLYKKKVGSLVQEKGRHVGVVGDSFSGERCEGGARGLCDAARAVDMLQLHV